MLRETALPVVVAGLLVLAGCAGASGPTLGSGNPTDSPDANTGTVNFYISDERNAIDDFEHLNVTITKVGFQKQGDGEDDEEDDVDENETDVEAANEEADDESEDQETDTVTDQNETETSPNTSEAGEDPPEEAQNESDDDEAQAEDAENETEDDENESRDGWVTHDVDNVTVDLTQYQGANATLLSSFDVPNGTYNKVFVYVSEINATLENGEQVNVKLPSQKLQLNSQFTVGNGEDIDFVFDITVFKAGNSGKYILKPVVSESGTDVPIEAEDRGNGDEAGPPEDAGENDANGEQEAQLDVSADGPVMAGEEVSIHVTDEGEGVGNAQVFVDGERVGQTDADGTIAVSVPDDAESLEVTVRYRGAEVETSVMVQSGSGNQTTTASS